MPGTDAREAALVVATPSGTTLVLNDLIGNIRYAPGVGGWVLRVAGFAGKAAQIIPKVVKLAIVRDARLLRVQLLKWAELESLNRILVSHGSPIEGDAGWVLRGLAASLE